MLRLSLLLKSSGVNTESSKESLHELAPLPRVSDVTVACSWCWAGICTDLPLSPCNTPLSLTIPSEPRRAYSCPLFILEDGFHISPWEDKHLPPWRSLDCLMFLCVLTYWPVLSFLCDHEAEPEKAKEGSTDIPRLVWFCICFFEKESYYCWCKKPALTSEGAEVNLFWVKSKRQRLGNMSFTLPQMTGQPWSWLFNYRTSYDAISFTLMETTSRRQPRAGEILGVPDAVWWSA